MARLGFIGNFSVPYTTENDRRWSFEQLGHQVITFQENKTTAQQLVNQVNKLDALFYSHTHNYKIDRLTEVFEVYKKHGVPTASIHLDRWVGLDRESQVGKEATWKTEHIFMADGSLEAVRLYEKHSLNWHWLKPGVVARDCYRAEPEPHRFPHPIIFVGSKQYHPEYSFRPQLIDWLKNTYRNQFAHYGGDGIKVMRGAELNTLYSTAKIVVGDSCFGSKPYYVSDRYYETRGRGGFLLHPHTQGFDHVGVANYQHGDFDDLKRVIDFYLSREAERESMRELGMLWVREHETYTHRSQEVLDIILG